jgi:hypothetical protein
MLKTVKSVRRGARSTELVNGNGMDRTAQNSIPIENWVCYGQGMAIRWFKEVPSFVQYEVWRWRGVSDMEFWIYFTKALQMSTQRRARRVQRTITKQFPIEP